MARKAKQLTPLPAPAKAQGTGATPLQSGMFYKGLVAGNYAIAGYTFALPALVGNVGVMAKSNPGWPQLGLCQGNVGGLAAHVGTPRICGGHYIVASTCGRAILFAVNCAVQGCGWALILYAPNYFTIVNSK